MSFDECCEVFECFYSDKLNGGDDDDDSVGDGGGSGVGMM